MEQQDELEALQRTREEKVRQIAEKRRQVEELKRRRAERDANREVRPQGAGAVVSEVTEAVQREKVVERAIQEEMGRGLESLVAEILSGGGAGTGGAKRASPEGPLRELRQHASELVLEPCAADRALRLRQELSVGAVHVDPPPRELYNRSVQTELAGHDPGEEPRPEADKVVHATSIFSRLADKARERAVKPDAPAQDQHPGAGKLLAQRPSMGARSEGAAAKAVSAEEREHIEGDPEFQAFFQRTTLLVERTLGKQTWDLAADLLGDAGGEAESQDALKYIDDYVEDRWAHGRPVTDVRFSPHHREMFLASYGQRLNAALSDPAGCMLVWNLAMRNRPELVFTSSSSVLTAHFHNFEPALFYGGTYSGAVVLWDARVGAAPVMRSPPSGKGHSHPVQAMQLVGTQNATNVITASNDGRLCVWSLAMLNLPQEAIDLKHEAKKRDLAVMTLSFPEGETNTLYVGAEDGSVCQVHIHGSKVGVTEVYEGHEGPVSGIDMHPHSHSGEAAQHSTADGAFDLALSSSFDWSVKLWMVKQHHAPVLSFDAFDDYVLDVKWHPIHPAAFVAVDAEGHVDLWNLNQSFETRSVRLESPHQRRLALNRCHWSADGRKLVTGDSEGTLSMYVGDRSLSQPCSEEAGQFQERVRQLQPIAPRSGREGGTAAERSGGGRSPDARH